MEEEARREEGMKVLAIAPVMSRSVVERVFPGAGLLSASPPRDGPKVEEAEGEKEVVRLKPLAVVPPLLPSPLPPPPPDCSIFKLSSHRSALLWER